MSYMCACGRSSSCLCELHTESGSEQPVTAVDVDALDKLREAATAGPWGQHPSDDEYVVGQVDGDDYVDVADTYAFRKSEGSADAALIVAAVNALPDLLAEVRQGRALRKNLTAIVDEMEDDESIGIPPHVPLLIKALRAVLADADPS